MNHAHILLVEDEKDIADLVATNITNLGHKVTVIANGSDAIKYIQDQGKATPDLFILDRMLPGVSGIEICKFLRMYTETKVKPILMLTAMTSPEQIVEGLDAGADDYVTKPFEMNVLLARIRVLLRRPIQTPSEIQSSTATVELKGVKIDTDQCKTWIEGKEIELTLSEYKILCTFLKHPGKVFTRNQLVEFIQDGPVHVTDRTIDTHIFGLRKKMGDHANLIETIRGVGYRIIGHD